MQPKIIGHRVVHGGPEFIKPLCVTKTVLKQLGKYNQLAPLHNPANLFGIKAAMKIWPRVKNIAVFDTMFFQDLPDYAYTYALPAKINRVYKIRKYGFHGLSHEWMMLQAQKKLKLKTKDTNLVTCHLGSGCSLTAIKAGKAIDNSMGLTPMAGTVMATRSGDLDPGVIFYLLKKLDVGPRKLKKILNYKSGWYGLSGVSSDLRDVLQVAGIKVPGYKSTAKGDKKQAQLAIKTFIYSIQKYLGAYDSLVGGAKAIVFSGGIGERNVTIRQMALKDLALAGKPKILIVPANEELMIAKTIFNF